MTIEQTTFLGASISSFSLALGWKGTPSSLTCNLVEDDSNGDRFEPGSVGVIKTFQFGDFVYRGILQKYTQSASTSGAPLYNVILVDPRELLYGVQLILEEYSGGVFNVPNVFNVFGALEDVRFGNSGVNESGMPWRNIVNKFVELVNTGTGMVLRGNNYFIDLSSLPALSDYYRVKGPTISLMDLINDLCDAALHDFFFSLQAGNVITLHTIDRSTEPLLNTITGFVNSVEGAVSKEVGLELRNEPCSKFLIGGPVEQLFYQTRNLLEDQENPEAEEDSGRTEALNTIWPFWGFDFKGNAILGRGPFEGLGPKTPAEAADFDPEKDEHHFEVDSRLVDVPGVGETYRLTILELRCALLGQETWEAFMWFTKPELSFQIGMVNGPKAFKDFMDRAIAAGGVANIKSIDAAKFAPLFGHMLRSRSGRAEDVAEEKIKMLYEFVLNYAQNYGRMFMVRIPDVRVAVEAETGIVRTSLEPADSGYFSEDVWETIVGTALCPSLIDRLTTEFGKIQGYVRFDNASNLDLRQISEDDMVISADAQSVFIKCDILPQVVFLQHPTGDEADDDNIFGTDDNSGIFSPRVVIVLPNPIRNHDLDVTDPAGLLRIIIADRLKGLPEVDDATVDELIAHFRSCVGADGGMFGVDNLAIIPQLAVVPLRNNRLNYGPWYAVGAEGPTELEYDSSLVPWNYGGFEVMNLVAQARVTDALANGQLAETGSIEVPGIPTLSLGGQLITGGPHITDIQVNIGPQGITTQYRMETWTRRFGRWAKSNEERLARFGKISRDVRRNLRAAASIPGIGSKYYKLRQQVALPARYRHESSSIFGVGHSFEKESGKRGVSVGFIPDYYANTFLGNQYENKSLVTFDTLFRPFSTKATVSGIAHFETPIGSEVINSSGLNPFKVGHDFSIVTHGTGIIPQNTFLGTGIDYTNQRGLALRGPVVIAGWGYDTNEKPVPNEDSSSPTDNFLTDYLQKSDQWKCGPLDAKWDNDRKVWVAGGDSLTLIRAINNLGFTTTLASGVIITDYPTEASGNIVMLRSANGVKSFLFRDEECLFVKKGQYYYPSSLYGDIRFGIVTSTVTPTSSGTVRLYSYNNNSLFVNVEAGASPTISENIVTNTNIVAKYMGNQSNSWKIIDYGCQL